MLILSPLEGVKPEGRSEGKNLMVLYSVLTYPYVSSGTLDCSVDVNMVMANGETRGSSGT